MANSYQEARLHLARAAAAFGGPDWGSLIIALRAYDSEMQKLLVQSPVDTLQVFQGRAQASTMLLEVFEQCRTIAEAAKAKEVKKP